MSGPDDVKARKCALVDCSAQAASDALLCAGHRVGMEAWRQASMGAEMYGTSRRWEPTPPRPPVPRYLALFDEAARRLKAAWRALRHGAD